MSLMISARRCASMISLVQTSVGEISRQLYAITACWGKSYFMNVTGTYSRYNFNVGQSVEAYSVPEDPVHAENFSFDYSSGIYDWSGRVDLGLYP